MILDHFPPRVRTLYEPFAGSAATSLAAAAADRAERFVIGDQLGPLAALWSAILAHPEEVADRYEELWNAQRSDPRAYYARVRDGFNRDGDPVALLYLLARCVKNAVRFNADGAFNQAADHRRLGANPRKMRDAIEGAAALLASNTEVVAGDYRATMATAGADDFVYLDPPYEGVGQRDPRYVAQLDRDAFVAALGDLDDRGVPYLVSFDGRRGDHRYGTPLPAHLGLERLEIDAGRSSQSTLVGRDDRTYESLYISRAARVRAVV